MSTAIPEITRKPYGNLTSDLKIGDVVYWDFSRNENHIRSLAREYGNGPMVISGFSDAGHLELTRRNGGRIDEGFFHHRVRRDEFLTALDNALRQGPA